MSRGYTLLYIDASAVSQRLAIAGYDSELSIENGDVLIWAST